MKAMGLCPYSREHVFRLESAGKWPRRIVLSPQKVVWDLDEIIDHIEMLASARHDRVYPRHD
jgi:predicted DNA-binding transcriptional regulator AlpA